MRLTDIPVALGPFGPADLLSLVFLLGCWLVLGWVTEHPPKGRPSVSELMKSYRREWMRQLVGRPRIFDSGIMSSLRQGTTFFASSSLIAVGGGLAVLGNTDTLSGIVGDLTTEEIPTLVWETKFLTAILFAVNAFLKFVWSHRQFSYCAIVMASVPNDASDPIAFARAAQAAELNITGAKSFNRGLASLHFGLCTLAWLLGPLALAVATVITTYIAWRREFASSSRQALLENLPE